jgi:hypothetical protein
MTRALAWRGLEEKVAEHVQVELFDAGVLARGVQLGVDPEPYRVDYRLDAPNDWITRRLEVEAEGAGWRRSLALERDGGGVWTRDGEHMTELDGAQDCDLAFSPLTNLMPIRRHGLHQRDGRCDFVMAWVRCPTSACTLRRSATSTSGAASCATPRSTATSPPS